MRTSPQAPIQDPGNVQNLSRRWHPDNFHLHKPAPDWETPYAWLPEVRVWSPAVAPPVLGLILVFIATLPAPASQSGGSAAASQSLPMLFLIYFVCGVVYGLFLYLAPSLNSWAKLLLGGTLLYALAALWFLGGAVLLIGGIIVCTGLGFFYLYSCRRDVPADTLHITVFAGRYWRAIPSGRALLLPGEWVHKQLPNPAREYTAPLLQVYLCDTAGNRLVIQATATVSYRYAPVDALSKRPMPDGWEDDLQRTIREILRDALAITGHAALEDSATGQLIPSGTVQSLPPMAGQQLAQTLLEQLRRHTMSQGLAIGWVRVRDLLLLPDPRFAMADPLHATPVVLPPLGLPTNNQPRDAASLQLPAESAEPEEVPVEALLDLYNMVQSNSIDDPETIRSIALAWRALGLDKERQASCPYDSQEVATLLFQYAASLEH